MNVAEINPLGLPSLPLAERRNLPDCPAIYLVLEGTSVLYIGRTEDLQQRWVAHHRYSQLKNNGSARIAWLECTESELLPAIESALIELFCPPLNGSPLEGYVRGRVPESVRARFKASCALQGRDMSEVLEELIKRWLEEHETPVPPPATKAKPRKGSGETS
jgi:hypothetical protein